MTITYALMEKMDDIAKAQPQLAQVLTLARATKLKTNNAGEVVGCVFERNGQTFEETGPVIIATGTCARIIVYYHTRSIAHCFASLKCISSYICCCACVCM